MHHALPVLQADIALKALHRALALDVVPWVPSQILELEQHPVALRVLQVPFSVLCLLRLPAPLALPVDIASTAARHLLDQDLALRDRFRLWAVAQLQLVRPALQEGTAFSAAQAPLATGRVLLARIPSKEQVSSRVAFLVPRGDIALPALRRCQDQVFVRLGRTLSWALV